MARAQEALGGIDVLVNNAGIVAATRIWDLPEDEFRRMVDVNLTGTYNVTRAALPALLASERKPAIVNLGSTAALRGGGFWAARITPRPRAGSSVSPRRWPANWARAGCAQLRRARHHRDGHDAGQIRRNWETELKQGIPLQRFGSPAEVAQAILFLASDLSSYSTGIVVDVNGGFHIH